MARVPSLPTKAIETLTSQATLLEKLLGEQEIELNRHGLILNPDTTTARLEMTEAVEELVEELDELEGELDDLEEELAEE